MKHELTMNSVLSFGKHYGETIERIFSYDHEYLIWLWENVNSIKFSEGLKKILREEGEKVWYVRRERICRYSEIIKGIERIEELQHKS